MSERSELVIIAGAEKNVCKYIDQKSEFNNRVKNQLEKLESLLGLQMDTAMNPSEQSKKMAERMDCMEITMNEVKISLKVIKARK
ncbi:BgTH12-05376 [Blumeria graminis f. sp. triticale]|uniref:BgTH12-05376 n=1 Tax=Blumeria graminis f. sp. triticale TaxID=1689686 RepID=A0A9W4D284_BLUGR|nr:BgTH12-05376 [Blumeria graminis f. sp. triticale]